MDAFTYTQNRIHRIECAYMDVYTWMYIHGCIHVIYIYIYMYIYIYITYLCLCAFRWAGCIYIYSCACILSCGVFL